MNIRKYDYVAYYLRRCLCDFELGISYYHSPYTDWGLVIQLKLGWVVFGLKITPLCNHYLYRGKVAGVVK